MPRWSVLVEYDFGAQHTSSSPANYLDVYRAEKTMEINASSMPHQALPKLI